MSKSGILDALRSEEQSLRRQLVAIQRAIEAIEGTTPPAAGRGTKQAPKAVAKREACDDGGQRKAVAERMRNYWASGRSGQGAGGKPKE